MTSEDTSKSTCSPEAVFGVSPPVLPDGQTTSPSGPRLAPASRSRKPARDSVTMTQGTCGRTWFDSSMTAVATDTRRLASWESKLAGRLASIGSTECELIWRHEDTKLGWSRSRLARWTPPHIRNRIYWVAVAHADFAFGRIGDEQSAGKFALDEQDARNAVRPGSRNESYWSDAEWIVCHDGKARRTKPGLRLLVDGLPGRVDIWRIAGNAISPVLAAEVLAALREALGRVNSSERDE